MVLGICKNISLNLVSFDWLNYKNKISLMNDFIDSMKPYYVSKAHNIDYYAYKDWLIGVTKNDSKTVYHETVTIMKIADLPISLGKAFP